MTKAEIKKLQELLNASNAGWETSNALREADKKKYESDMAIVGGSLDQSRQSEQALQNEVRNQRLLLETLEHLCLAQASLLTYLEQTGKTSKSPWTVNTQKLFGAGIAATSMLGLMAAYTKAKQEPKK